MITTVTGPPRAEAPALPSELSMGLSRGVVELKLFVREKEAMIFAFIFPALLMTLLGSLFGDAYGDTGVTASQVFAASMIAYGIINTTFITIGAGISSDREDGTLKRLRGTPITATSYFAGKVVLVLVITLAEIALMLAVAVLAFDMPLPDDVGRWFTFVWVLALSVLVFTLLGIAASALTTSARTAGTVLSVPAVVLAFLSGIFMQPINQLPEWMLQVASVFPLKWVAQGFRSVFLPDEMLAWEAARSWELTTVALVLGAWCVIGLALSLLTFRWSDRRAG
ncbi:MAG: ABC transporter permease [Thermocrispum sp.]